MPMLEQRIQQQFFDANNWPFGAALTTLLMGFLLFFMASRCAPLNAKAFISCSSFQRLMV